MCWTNGKPGKTGSVTNSKNQRVFSHVLRQTRREKWHANNEHPSYGQRRSEIEIYIYMYIITLFINANYIRKHYMEGKKLQTLSGL